MFGFINIYKPKGYTSFDVIACLRKITQIKQIGHSGTLDPFAEGVLPVAIGKASKLIEYLSSHKTYLATIQFGANTDTYDLEGKITQQYDKKVTPSEVKDVLKKFEGEIEQFPPVYSAIKVNGKKLYEYARKNERVEIKPRKVKIYKLELINFDESKQTCKIRIDCAQGVYIRSIAYDAGKALGCGGHLIELVRERSGNFEIKDSLKLEELKTVSDVEKNLINPLNVISFPEIPLSGELKQKVSNGVGFENKKYESGTVVFLTYSGKIYAIGQVEKQRIRIKKVFGL